MIALLAFGLVSLVAAQKGIVPPPTASDYKQITQLTKCCYQGTNTKVFSGILPWPHTYPPGGHYKHFSWSDLQYLGNRFFSSLPSTQNKTLLAAVVYDWLLPTYRRTNWYLTATSGGHVRNSSALVRLFDETYIPTSYSNPYIDEAFKIDATSRSERANQINGNFTDIAKFAQAESNMLRYAASQFSQTSYSVHPKLYRGSREVEFFCNRFTQKYGMTVDQCVNQYMGVGSTFCTQVFWSTSPRTKYLRQYSGVAIFNVAQNSTRTSWFGSPIGQLTGYADEYLYVPGSCFTVQAVTCSSSTGTTMWHLDVTEAGFDQPRPVPMTTFTKCTSNVAVQKRMAQDKLPEEATRFFH